MVNVIKRMTNSELKKALDRVTDRNEAYQTIIDLMDEDGPEDIEFVTGICKEIIRRQTSKTVPKDYLALVSRYHSLEDFTEAKTVPAAAEE